MYSNPILQGFYPDPSICRAGNDYYLTCSSFTWFPSLPVFHCRDLVHCKLAGHVFTDASRISLEGLGVSKGFFAPSIRYHDGLFYITCTLVDGGGNFVVTARDPAGPWSDPVWLENVRGIDPSLFFHNGTCRIIYNSEAPGNLPLYNGHRTIRMQTFDLEKLQAKGDEIILVNGGTDLSLQPRWIEGPHLFFYNNWFYLIAAQGGTGYDHSVVAFRSRNAEGPFLPCPENPVLQTAEDKKQSFPITSTGHADLVETPAGDWHAVFLGCRPYRGDEYNTGRETFLVSVGWHKDWPVLNPVREKVEYFYPDPLPVEQGGTDLPRSGNFCYQDDFDEDRLSADWISLRTSSQPWYHLEERKGWLGLDLKPDTCASNSHPSLIGHRQQHLYAEACTLVDFEPANEKEKAGLLVFQNEDHFYFISVSVCEEQKMVSLYRSLLIPRDPAAMELLASDAVDSGPLELSILALGECCRFYYALRGQGKKQLGTDLDAGFLSTAATGGFTGCCFCLYATSSGQHSENRAFFDWFRYKGDDPVYRKEKITG